MLFRSLLLFSVAAIAPISAAAIPGYEYGPPPTCLTDYEVEAILKIWKELWVSDYSQIDKVMAKDYVGYEFDNTAGKDVPFAKGIKAFEASVSPTNDPTQSDAVGIKEFTVSEFHSCDKIAFRWKFLAKTTGLHKKKTGIGAGKEITFDGIDLLTIDLASKKIKESVTSQDYLTFYTQIGYSEQPTK